MKVGSFVTYDDEDPDTTDMIGEVVEPTQAELDYVAEHNFSSMDGPIGPENGDLLIQWGDGEFDRSWEHPSYLIPVSVERTISV